VTFRSRKLLDLARGQPCVMCGRDDGTVVAAHSNLMEHGKGKSIKAHDAATAHLCFVCHTEIDQGKEMSREERRDFMLTAIVRTILRLFDQGRLEIK
jgi:Putative nuclease YbcO/Protein of unknown function (DUF968)